MVKLNRDKNQARINIQPRPAIAGKIVIVTGASSGIGEAAARAFAEAGATVILAARRAERLQNLSAEINGAGGHALAVPTDLCKREQITHLVQTTLDTFYRIDVLANIAGWGRYDWFEELSYQDLRNQYEVNVLGLAELTRQVIPTMKATRSGYIINMNSYASEISVPPITVYSSTKHALAGLSDGLRRELLPWGIEVISIHAGGVKDTEFNRHAAARGGVGFNGLPIARVPREEVARQMVALVETPKRSVFLGRIYGIPVFFDRRFPELVDRLGSMYVRLKRGTEFGERSPQAVSRVVPAAIGLVSLLSIMAVARRTIHAKLMHH